MSADHKYNPFHVKDAIPQIRASIGSFLGSVNSGMVMGFTGVALPLIRDDASIFTTIEDEKWIASITMLGMPVGSTFSAVVQRSFGLRKIMCLAAISYLIGWIIIVAAPLVSVIYTGRFLGGFAVGMLCGSQQVYLAEISDSRPRGVILSISPVLYNVGVFLISCLELFMSWRALAISGAIVSLLFLVFQIFCSPESPVRLVEKGDMNGAKKSLRRLRSKDYDVNEEIDAMMEKNVNNEQSTNLYTQIRALISKRALKPFAILVMLFFTQQFSGFPVTTFYAIDLLKPLGGDAISPRIFNLILTAYRVVLSALTALLIATTSVRRMLIVTGFGMTIFMLSIVGFEYWKSFLDNGISYWVQWIPAICLMAFITFYTPGFGTIPWILLGVMLPTDVKDVACNLVVCLGLLFVFLVVYSYPLLIALIHLYGTFFFYGSICLLGTVITFAYFPETHGITLDEIEEKFVEKNNETELMENDELQTSKFIDGKVKSEKRELVTVVDVTEEEK